MIEILYFARLREQLQTEKEFVEAADAPDIGGLITHLSARGDAWEAAFGPGHIIMAAVNQEMANLETRIKDGDEVAFFPPVTGG